MNYLIHAKSDITYSQDLTMLISNMMFGLEDVLSLSHRWADSATTASPSNQRSKRTSGLAMFPFPTASPRAGDYRSA